MENGPIASFDKMTNRQIFNLFIDAVNKRNTLLITEHVLRDGLKLKINRQRIAMYFAQNNDITACEILASHGANINDFILGAILGNHLELVKKYYTVSNENYNVFVAMAQSLERKEIRDFLINDDYGKLFSASPISEKIFKEIALLRWKNAVENKTHVFDIKDIKEHGDKLVLFAAEAGDEELLFRCLSVIKKPEWDLLIAIAAEFGHFELVDKLINKWPDPKANSCAAYGAVEGGYLSEAIIYLNTCQLTHQVDYNFLAQLAAEKGDIFTAETVLSHLAGNEKPDYVKCYLNANEHGFLYASKYFRTKAGLEREKQIAEIAEKNRVEQQRKESQPGCKIAKAIEGGVEPILTFDVPKQAEMLKKYESELILHDSLNHLLEAMLTMLESEKLLCLVKYKKNIFISENEPSYEVLKSLALKYSWINRTCFSMPRAKLEVLNQNARVDLPQFYIFINQFRSELLLLKNANPKHQVKVEEVLKQEEKPKEITNRFVSSSAVVNDLNNSSSKANHPKREKIYTQFSATTNNTISEKNLKPKVHIGRQQKPKSKTSVKPNKISKIVESKSAEKSIKPLPSSLPAKGEIEKLPLREPKADLEVFLRRESINKNTKTDVVTDAYLDTLKMFLSQRKEISTMLGWLTFNQAKSFQICDLALLDLIFKINRGLYLGNGKCINKEIYSFDSDLIHGLHHYLKENINEPSNLTLFVQNSFGFDSDNPLKDYIDGTRRQAHSFVKQLQNSSFDSQESIQRLKLIKQLYDLQFVCYKLCHEQNNQVKLLAMHALSASIIMLGEQYAKLDESIREKLIKSPLGHLLNSYRCYRNLRHGNSDSIKLIHLSDLELDVVFNLEKDDWNESLNKMLSNFHVHHEKYFNDEHTMFLDELIWEFEMLKPLPNQYLPNYDVKTSSKNQPDEVSVLQNKINSIRL